MTKKIPDNLTKAKTVKALIDAGSPKSVKTLCDEHNLRASAYYYHTAKKTPTPRKQAATGMVPTKPTTMVVPSPAFSTTATKVWAIFGEPSDIAKVLGGTAL